MEQGKQHGQCSAMDVLAAEKYSFPGNKHIIENNVRIRITDVGIPCFIMGSLAYLMNMNNLFHSIVIRRHGKCYRVLLFIRSENSCGNNHNLISDGCFGNMQFTASDHNAVALFFNDSQVHIGIGLFGRSFKTLTLHVGLSTATGQIVFLKILQPFEKIFVILRAAVVLFVRLKTCRVDGINRIRSHASLNTHSAGPAQCTRHVLFVMQILRVLMNVTEAIDGFACQMGFCRAQIPEFGNMRGVEGKAHDV